MNDLSPVNTDDVVQLTASIVASYVSHNSLKSMELSGLIGTVHGALARLNMPAEPEAPAKPVPHMPIKKTVTRDYLVSLEDQRHYQSLKRHLAGRGLTPAQYREKWGLAHDYPMTAPGYSERRSALAKSLGLGQIRRKAAEAEPEAPAKRRGRPKSKPQADD